VADLCRSVDFSSAKLLHEPDPVSVGGFHEQTNSFFSPTSWVPNFRTRRPDPAFRFLNSLPRMLLRPCATVVIPFRLGFASIPAADRNDKDSFAASERPYSHRHHLDTLRLGRLPPSNRTEEHARRVDAVSALTGRSELSQRPGLKKAPSRIGLLVVFRHLIFPFSVVWMPRSALPLLRIGRAVARVFFFFFFF